MQYRRLGRTDIQVSSVGFGCWAIVGGFTWGDQDERDSLAALRAAYDSGITLFDTAEGYGNGHSEALLAKALGEKRDELVLASKASASHSRSGDLRAACERSLRHLQTDRIDLYQLHWPSRKVPLAETVETLDSLQQEGKIRAYGVSNFGPGDLRDCLEVTGAAQSNQIAYNLLFRAAEWEIEPTCVEHDMSLLCYSPLMQGLLTGKFSVPDDVPPDRARTRHFSGTRPHARHGEAGAETLTFETVDAIRSIAEGLGEPMGDVALAWLLQRPGVTAVLAGGRNAVQARSNARAAALTLPDTAVAALDSATQSLKEALGKNADMWQNPPRIR